MDIVLVNSIDFVYENKLPDMGQLILRDILKDKYKVTYVNFDHLNYVQELRFSPTPSENIEQFSRYILEMKPKVVAFYTICNSFYTTLKVAEAIKNADINIKIVFGGPHATMIAESCLRDFSYVDVISSGEAERSIMPLMDQLILGGELADIPGIVYRHNNTIKRNACCELLSNDELTQFNIYDYQPVKITSNTKIDLEVGRGCPFSCTFCSTNVFWGRKFRIKPVQDIIAQMIKLRELYGVNRFSLIHDLFTADKRVVHEFCNSIIESGLNFEWDCSSRIDVLDQETILLMKRANCKSVFLGIETGSEIMQKRINKNLNLDKAQELVKFMIQSGIRVTASFIYGLPDESIAEFKKTIRMMECFRQIGVKDLQLHKFMVLPETIEMNHVRERLFFDEKDINNSIFNRKIYDKDAIDLIQNHKEAFTQFYTFESDVRVRFKRFDFFYSSMLAAAGIFDCCVDLLLKEYGWEFLYTSYLEEIEQLYESQRTSFLNDELRQYKFISDSCKLIIKMLENEALGEVFKPFKQIFEVEKTFFEFCESQESESLPYSCQFNLLEAKKSRTINQEDVWIKFKYTEGQYKIEQLKAV